MTARGDCSLGRQEVKEWITNPDTQAIGLQIRLNRAD